MEKREGGPASPFLSLLLKHTHLCPGLSNLGLDKKGEREVVPALWRMDADRKLLRTRVGGTVKEDLEDVGCPTSAGWCGRPCLPLLPAMPNMKF